MWVAERDETEAREHCDTGISTLALLHEIANGSEDILLVDTELAGLLELVGEDVKEELGVRGGVDVSVRFGVHEAEQARRVDHVSILYVD